MQHSLDFSSSQANKHGRYFQASPPSPHPILIIYATFAILLSPNVKRRLNLSFRTPSSNQGSHQIKCSEDPLPHDISYCQTNYQLPHPPQFEY